MGENRLDSNFCIHYINLRYNDDTMKRLPLAIIFAAFLISGSVLSAAGMLTGSIVMYAAAALVLFLYSCCKE